ncbi:MAG: hypothetical protein FWD78_18055 [Treponema sp.]|nr:hypothetical protein [Treponema sp.]
MKPIALFCAVLQNSFTEFINNTIRSEDDDTNNTDSQKEYLYAVMNIIA